MKRTRPLRGERLESRHLMAADTGISLHNAALPPDVNEDGRVSAVDALTVINHLNRRSPAEGEPAAAPDSSRAKVDVNNSGAVTALDALLVINEISPEAELAADALEPLDFSAFPKAAGVGSTYTASLNRAARLGSQNLLTADDVDTLLSRASMATRSNDAIVAVVDRSGRILGVRVEAGVDAELQDDPRQLAFAIDGAVAKARTAAFFSSNAAPLPSRTVRFISQSTMTQREVESSPTHPDAAYRGPGFVAPIGVGGHFPPEVAFTPQVDLFAIEHQSRDSQIHPGADGVKGTSDDFALKTRFNADPIHVPSAAEQFFSTWPESYGVQTEDPDLLDMSSRGIATLPGGIPLYKFVKDRAGETLLSRGAPLSQSVNLVGGIGVFFPGENGFATEEQGFVHASRRGGVPQSEKARTNADRVLESEFAALIAAAGDGGLVGPKAFDRDLSAFNRRLPALPDFFLPTGRIDLVGITLEIYGPHPDRSFRQPGIDRLISVGRSLGRGSDSGENQVVDAEGRTLLAGQPVPEGWLIAPHDSSDSGGLKAEDVDEIITQGIAEAERTRAAIRLDLDNNFRPGPKTRMVLAVADTDGELLGVYRMPDATIFSIDVSIAKARNTAYYADPSDLQNADRIDFNGDERFGPVTKSLNNPRGDTVPRGTALTNRTFRFLVEPRFPTGSELSGGVDRKLVNDPDLNLCDQKPGTCGQVGPHSILRTPGINPATAENLVDRAPLEYEVYADPSVSSFLAFDAFNPARNFRDPGDSGVVIAGTGTRQPLANQNGVVFFPGSTPLYVSPNRAGLAGGFGVSGDGVDQDDVVTAGGQTGYAPPQGLRVDTYVVGGVRLPFQKFNRNPFGS